MAVIAAAVMLFAGAALGQFEQYIVPGSLGIQELPTKQRLETAMKEAPFNLGPLRLGLWFALHDISWVNNVYGTALDPKSDFTATATLGLHGYLPVGPKFVFGLYALPEYVWWNELTYLRGWNGKYGLGVFGYFNAVTLELQAGDWRSQQFYSTENPIPVNVEQQRGGGTLEVTILGRLSIFGNAWEDRWRYESQTDSTVPTDVLQLSDRNETAVGGGLRYRFSESFTLALGYQQLTNDFLSETQNRSNSGDGRYVEFDLRGHRLWANAYVTALSLRPEGDSEFVPLDTTTGRAQIGVKLAGKLELELYGGRSVSYTLLTVNPYYVDQRWGLGLQSPLGWRTTGRVFWEQGSDDYAGVPGQSVERTDDFNGYGLSLHVKLGEGSEIGLEGAWTDYSSILPEFNRKITRVQVTLTLAGAGGQWW
ncbi:MAG TPA: hypothetical protein VMT45_05775 [Thermoanaerobaculaceae bacterium]|nr:hypothetical protein [Thermoanaerobaculaceae bacterium]